MLSNTFLFTSESVTEGHPDKMADQISDAVLDAILAQDPYGRVACESLLTTGLVMVAGEITTNCYVEIPEIVRQTVKDVGYTRAKFGFDYQTCGVVTSIQKQSPDIAMGVDKGGAGDQGMMFGYACDETEQLMPLPIYLAHKLTRRMAEVRKNGTLRWMYPDGKSQVTVEYHYGKPARIHTVLISTQHADKLAGKEITNDQIRKDLIEHVINPVLPKELVDEDIIIFTNPTGRFVVGGPLGDSGLTGRKIIVDTYGGYARHGGGAFSGKDATKVDRSASYMARYIAKNLVAAGLARKLEIQISYGIGMSEPLSIAIDTFGTSQLSEAELIAIVKKHFKLRPLDIINDLDLRRPIYEQTAVYGHFGRNDLDLPWERLDKVAELKQYLEE